MPKKEFGCVVMRFVPKPNPSGVCSCYPILNRGEIRTINS